MSITHTKVSAVPDGGDATKVQPTDWNAAHELAAGYFLPRIATITLNDAQIKDVGTPYVIVPATEDLDYTGVPTQLPVPLALFISVDTLAGGYTNVSGDIELGLVLGSDWSLDLLGAGAGGLGSVGVQVIQPLSILLQTFSSSPDEFPHVHGVGFKSTGNLNGNIQDNALAIVIDNPAGDLADGHADNSLTATIIYTVITL